MIRAFLGIDLPAAVRGALQVQQFLLPLPRKVEPENLHLTLVFLGECPESALEAAHEGFEALRERCFPLVLQGVGLFGKDKPRVAWAGVGPSPELMKLQAKVETLARRAGCPIDARKFSYPSQRPNRRGTTKRLIQAVRGKLRANCLLRSNRSLDGVGVLVRR